MKNDKNQILLKCRLEMCQGDKVKNKQERRKKSPKSPLKFGGKNC